MSIELAVDLGLIRAHPKGAPMFHGIADLHAEYTVGQTTVELDAIPRQAWITGRDRSGTYHEISVQLDDLADLAAHIVTFAEARDEDTVFEYLEDLEDQRLGVPHPAAHYA